MAATPVPGILVAAMTAGPAKAKAKARARPKVGGDRFKTAATPRPHRRRSSRRPACG